MRRGGTRSPAEWRNEIGYQFAGYFARPAPPALVDPPPDAVWKAVAAPFDGVGIRLLETPWLAKAPPAGEIEALAARLGLHAADSWLYLNYETWGGAIDYVYALGSQAGTAFGPIEDSSLESVERTYTDVMRRFGVSAEDALDFPPFARGWWGEK